MIQRILQADWLYTGVADPIKRGMLAIDEHQRIIAVGNNVAAEGVSVEYFEGILCPGFVNTHCHLELSHLKGKVSQKTGLNGFIQELQQVRSAEEQAIQQAIQEANEKMREEGIVAVGDISNGMATLPIKKDSSIVYHTFVELFGFDATQADSVAERGRELRDEWERNRLKASIVPHSPYSVSKELFLHIAGEKQNTPLCIHNQETAAENELYEHGQGKMMDMLQSFELDTTSFKTSGKTSLLSYLELLPKEVPLQLVHNTFTSKEDIQQAELQHQQLYWCFCPKANLFIENRLPDIPSFAEAGVKCTMGTDSLASNDSLSIWDEITTIQAHYPNIALETLISWATINGAEFLGIDQDYGSLEVGKLAAINHIKEQKLTSLKF